MTRRHSVAFVLTNTRLNRVASQYSRASLERKTSDDLLDVHSARNNHGLIKKFELGRVDIYLFFLF